MFYNDFWLKHHQHLGFQLLLDQFCEGQAYNSFEGGGDSFFWGGGLPPFCLKHCFLVFMCLFLVFS